jgi:hypothetical protein
VVAGADRVTFEGTSLTVEGGDWWTALVSPHAVMVPSVVREYVPVTLGGSLGTHRPWWGIDLGGLPLELHRASGQAILHLEDRVVAKKTWEVTLESWSVGPPGDVAPLTASGKLARGTFQATGVAQPDGKLSVSLGAKDMEGKELEVYVARALSELGLKASGGKMDLQLDLGLNQQRLTVVGEVVVRKVNVAVQDREKLAARAAEPPSSSTVQLDERRIPIDIACMLDDTTCSPLGQIATAVSDTLIAGVLQPAE